MSKRPKTKRQQQKEDSKKARRYLQARFNEKIGYIFIAAWYFIKNNFIYHIKKIAILIGVLTLILLGFSIYNFVKASHIQKEVNGYEGKNVHLEHIVSDKQKDIDDQDRKIDDYNISSSPKVIRASKIISQVFHGMYDYKDGSEYKKNRNKNMKHFTKPSSKEVKSIYNEDKDSSGDSIIDNLNLRSSLLEYNIYTDKIKVKDTKVINLKAIVEYQSDILGVSSDYASRTHDTIYDIKFNTENNKIISIKKVNTLKESKSVD